MTNPIVHPQMPHVSVASACMLGEGPVWDERSNTLFWVDIKNPAVWRYHPETSEHSRIEAPERIGFIALTSDPDVVIAGFKSGLGRFNLKTGEAEPIIAPEKDLPGNRINDGYVGPDGAIYFGTMHDDETDESGSFWRWDGKELTQFHSGFIVTNGPAFSHDGQVLYATDTVNGTIHAFDVKDGQVGERRRFVQFEKGWGHPDGMAVDAEGYVWVCHWGGSHITRFAPDGSVERTVPVPTAQVTKCAFAGPDLTTLYITTAAIGHDPHVDPMAGHLFKVETGGIRGLKTNIFQG